MNICRVKRKFKTIFIYSISWKFLIFLGLVALSLQTVSIGLSWWIQAASSKKYLDSKEISHNLSHPEDSITASGILNYIIQNSILDSSGEFKFVVAVLAGSSTKKLSDVSNKDHIRSSSEIHSDKNAVTLVSQCSLSHLHMVTELAERWEGPLSIALFLLSEEIQMGVQMLLLLYKCFPSIHSNTSFSIVYPVSSSVSPNIQRTAMEVPCHLVISSLSNNNNRSNYEFNGISYPNNLLRNVARKGTKNDYMMVLDIDMLPSMKLHSRFMEYIKAYNLNARKGTLLSKEKEKTVWVVPSYEIDQNVHVPDYKSDILQLRKSGLARPFYQELCWKCQKYTEYDIWEKNTKSNANESPNLSSMYEVLWKDPWEPFYISKSDVPFYDERFRQYGFNRISQVCELHIAGYRFLVLDSAFVVHKGFKKLGQLHRNKDEEMEKNRMIFREFKENLKEKYSESSRRCY